ncbi:trypsin-like peptidase [Streptomyces puniciscabiei]|uniref:Trypsin-like peptidase n=2 Tax=Streptomyces puniciscabiei TaxID=164348 RepID=A0A542UA21_9ACTN|nr:trypsin-like peptidase [Streptomyces puniciscabiei]
MGWFRRSGDITPTLVSVMRVRAMAEDPSVAGAGALLSPRYVLTCAHVVSDALGKQPTDIEPPTRSARLDVMVRQGAELHRSTARLVVWVPPRHTPGNNWGEGDLAVLELDEPATPPMRAVTWQDMTEGLRVRAWHGGGDTGTFADTTIKAADAWYYFADADLRGASIQHGYSGGPLCREDDLTVAVGLVTSHVINDRLLSDRQVVRRTLTVPWQRIRDELERAEAHDVIAACLRAPFTDTGNVPDGAVDLLLRLFDSREQLKYQANRLAKKLGFHMTTEEPDTAVLPLEEELAALLFTEGRALATLAELLTDVVGEERRKTLDRLVALGRTQEGVRLLSVGEHHRLLALLTPVNAAHPRLLCQAARHVLQLAHRLPEWVYDGAVPEARLAAAVADLDQDSADMMPPLLRLAVFLSAAVADKELRKELDAWCDDVGRRLGRDRSLLTDCRAQASSWVKSRRRPLTRIVVDLSRNDADCQRYTCHIWRVREGRAPQEAGISAGPYTAEEIGREIHGLAGEHGNGGDEPAPWIDVVVAREHLDVPVDGWTASTLLDELAALGISSSDADDSPLVLGAQYQMALRLREYYSETEAENKRRQVLARRWAAGRTGPLVIKEDTNLLVLLRAMTAEYSDVSWTVLHGGPLHREKLLAICLAHGVPVVLWDREAAHAEQAQRLDEIVGSVALPDLPEAVRRFREEVYYGVRTAAARPAMVWDDPGMALPMPPDYGDPPDALTNSGRMAAR